MGPKVQTVLGLSITATSGAWVLLDGQGPDAATLDDDAFDVRPDDGVGHRSLHAAAVRGAQAIAATSGHKIGAIHVTWTENVEADATALLGSLADSGFDNVHAIPLSKAARGWGIDIGRENQHAEIGLCILERDTATLMVVATPTGSVRTAITDTRETPEDLIDWLRTVFDKDGWSPERLYFLGALADLDEVLEPIAGAVPVPVSDSTDTQLALARGAALATVTQLDAGAARPAERPWRMSLPKRVITADTETVAMATAEPVDSDSAAEALRDDEPRSDRPWLVSHARKVTLSAAAVAVFGVALSLTAGSALNIESPSTQAAEPAAESAPLTSAAPRPVPAPTSVAPAPQARPLAAQPPAPPTPPQTFAPPAESGTVAAEPVTVPQHTAFASPPAAVSAAVPDVPLPGSPRGVPPGPQFVDPLGPPPGPPPAAPLDVPAAPPPVAPFGLPPGPAPAVPLAVPAAPEPLAPLGPAPGPQPFGPPPGPQPADPLAVPAAPAPAVVAAPAPPPVAAPPAPVAAPQAPVAVPPADVAPPAGAADSAPPLDPVQSVLGPLVGPLP